ncbi:septum formation initiator family protein [Paraglaciecola sp.]|nr:septum formation initiator family protein [Paraglaciecola sp.]MDB4281927.1 septum formation initiator family protein [Paraglaciecola sp.]
MRWVLAGLLILLVFLQYRLWLAEGGIAEALRLSDRIAREEALNSELEARNALLERQVLELQTGDKVIEQRAREQLGLIREDEVYFQFVDPAETPESRDKNHD